MIVCSVDSFIAQYRRIHARGDCDGISPYYVLCNLIVAAENAALALFYMQSEQDTDDVVHTPLTPYKYLNVPQFVVVWACHMYLLVYTLLHAHTHFISPVVTAVGVLALFPQRREIRSRSDPGALSTRTLALQAGVFAVVGLSWLWRLPSPGGMPFTSWYPLAGWAPVNYIIFAAVQGILWWFATRQGRVKEADGETQTLLGA
ncbi:hypothetical protein F5B20DRAFT_570592 [Whalleya microplaca]|nr:hypothetical protein F5B20DRAFT_570592 [Whalleya microplaca]